MHLHNVYIYICIFAHLISMEIIMPDLSHSRILSYCLNSDIHVHVWKCIISKNQNWLSAIISKERQP